MLDLFRHAPEDRIQLFEQAENRNPLGRFYRQAGVLLHDGGHTLEVPERVPPERIVVVLVRVQLNLFQGQMKKTWVPVWIPCP